MVLLLLPPVLPPPRRQQIGVIGVSTGRPTLLVFDLRGLRGGLTALPFPKFERDRRFILVLLAAAIATAASSLCADVNDIDLRVLRGLATIFLRGLTAPPFNECERDRRLLSVLLAAVASSDCVDDSDIDLGGLTAPPFNECEHDRRLFLVFLAVATAASSGCLVVVAAPTAVVSAPLYRLL